MTDERRPLTDEDLAEIEREAEQGDTSTSPSFIANGALRLIAEVRRLRYGLDEIAAGKLDAVQAALVAGMTRRHRGGKA